MTLLPVGTTTGDESAPPPAGSEETGAPTRADPGAEAAVESDVEPGATPEGEPAGERLPEPAGEQRAEPATSAAPGDSDATERRSHFTLWLAAVATLAAGIQALFIHAVARRPTLPAAAWYDTVQAHQLVRGRWFVDPVQATSGAHLLVPTAAHPPLSTLLLAVADVASATGPTSHRVFLAILFVASVILAGLTVRDQAGERAGILAGLVFATFPLLWVNPATGGPETTVIAVTTLVLFAAVRFWARPTTAHAALVGLALGLCALTRTDLVALVVLVGLPLGLLVKQATWTVRIRGLAVMGALFLLVVGPWVGRNLALFGPTVVLSEDYGPALAGANCAATASGPLEGWWSPACLAAVSPIGRDQPTATRHQVQAARAYVSHHQRATVGVAAARLGRVWNVYRPGQSAELEAATGRPAWVSRLGQWYFAVLVPVALLGAVVLRRRRLLLFPWAAMILLSSLTAVLAFGDARFAVEADVALALLAGVALDAGAAAAGRRWSAGPGRHSAGRSPRAP
jgi:hypothetical protein